MLTSRHLLDTDVSVTHSVRWMVEPADDGVQAFAGAAVDDLRHRADRYGASLRRADASTPNDDNSRFHGSKGD